MKYSSPTGRSRSQLQHFPTTLLLVSISCMRLVTVIAIREAAETRCFQMEKKALLEFKNGFTDEHGVFSSWRRSSQDCCLWKGVGCSNRSNHVAKLDLHGYWSDNLTASVGFTGEISSSLLKLRHLKHLDLSFNTFTQIPKFIGSMKELRYLNLSFIEILEVSEIPPQLGNLSNLETLDLTASSIMVKDTEWVSKLSSLEYLSLSFVSLSESKNLLQNVLTKLPSLFELQLVSCHLPGYTPATPYFSVTNFSKSISIIDITNNLLLSSSIYPWLFNLSGSLTNIGLTNNDLLGTIPEAFGDFRFLQVLDMSLNGLEGGVPSSFGNLSNLQSLYLGQNYLNGDLPSFFHNLSGPPQKSMEVLELSKNKLSGSLPDFTTFTGLRELHLQYNELNGSFPQKFEHNISNLFILDLAVNRITGLLPDLSALSSLKELYVERNNIHGTIAEKITSLFDLKFLGASSNMFHGTITETHVTNLSHLTYLDLSYNSLILEFSSDSSPVFLLDVMLLSNCTLGPSFPTWLRTQKNLSIIDISDAQINDSVPIWFWEQLTPTLRYLNLSHNQIHGVIPADLTYGDHPYIDFSSNSFSGPVPLFPSDIETLVLYNNKFSGSVSFLCDFTEIGHIDLSNNKLSGELPDCWMKLSDKLFILNLENNNFSGRIPKSLGSLGLMIAMSIRSNRLTGELPSSLQNCTWLQFLDVGENNLSGRVPSWIGKTLTSLRVLSLQSNRFHGTIPTSICNLENLQILDISVNDISGTIPTCFGNIKGMIERKTELLLGEFESNVLVNFRTTLGPSRYVFRALLQWKGMKYEYKSTLGLVTSLDLSSNHFNGEIPNEIANLLGLVALNLSRNNFTWKIPQNIGRLIWLDFIDLSRNQLVGNIPTSFSQLAKIGVMDVSYNNLSGRIPTSTQLQSFDVSSYVGNRALCGLPLSNPCPGDFVPEKPPPTVESDEFADEDKLLNREFFICVLIGLVFGFWGVCGTLVVKDSWRHAYFELLIFVKDWIYVVIVVNYAKLKRRY